MEAADFEEQYEVESVVGHVPKNATRYRTKHYHIKWKNYDDDENTWEDKKTMEQEIPDLIDAYWIDVSKKKKALKKGLTKLADSMDKEIDDIQAKLIKPGRTLTASEMGIKEEAVSDSETATPSACATAKDHQLAAKSGKKSKPKPKQEVNENIKVEMPDPDEAMVDAPPTPPPAEESATTKPKRKPKKEKVKKETGAADETDAQSNSTGRSRRRGTSTRVSYREIDEDQLSGMEDEDADEDFNPDKETLGGGNKRRRVNYAPSESDEEGSEAEEQASGDSNKENAGPAPPNVVKPTAPKPSQGAAASSSTTATANLTSSALTSSTSSNFRSNTTNKSRFQKHCKSCGKVLTAAEIANPHSTDLAPFQARLDYLIKERKKYEKMLAELEAANLSDEENAEDDTANDDETTETAEVAESTAVAATG